MENVFHAGERAVQRRLGVQRTAERVGQIIQPSVPKDFQRFLEAQSFLVISTTDATGYLWASALCGKPGFIRVVDERTVCIRLSQNHVYSLVQNHIPHNNHVGLIVMNFAYRVRIRINGTVKGLEDGAIVIKTEQVYGNCPKYIQARQMKPGSLIASAIQEVVRDERLDTRQQTWIGQADTFFIASANATGKTDVSHRGGPPGFVRVLNDRMIAWPDYTGNMMFNTLGNLVENPNAGLLFMDFSGGHTLEITGTCTIQWHLSSNERAQFPGGKRLCQFRITEVIDTRNALSCSWDFLNASPFNP